MFGLRESRAELRESCVTSRESSIHSRHLSLTPGNQRVHSGNLRADAGDQRLGFQHLCVHIKDSTLGLGDERDRKVPQQSRAGNVLRDPRERHRRHYRHRRLERCTVPFRQACVIALRADIRQQNPAYRGLCGNSTSAVLPSFSSQLQRISHIQTSMNTPYFDSDLMRLLR